MKNQLTAMKDQILALGQYKATGRVLKGCSGYRLPAVKDFGVCVNNYNKILEAVGIKLRLKPDFEYKTTSINRCNRYMKHQLMRIVRYKKENNKLAGVIAISCIQRSVCFRMSAFNHVFPQWYFSMDKSYVHAILRKVNKIVARGDFNLDYKRVLIPKTATTFRPLGVPTPEGRVALHMGNNMLTEMLKSEIGESQHAYLPGKGTLTAGRELISKLNQYKYAYETDLKGFFDNISTELILNKLEKMEVPLTVRSGLQQLCYSMPKLTKQSINPEEYYKKREVTLKHIDEGVILERLLREQVGMTCKGNGKEFYLFILEDGFEDPGLGIQGKFSAYDVEFLKNQGLIYDGVPQGMPLSPLLSILPLKENYLYQAPHVNYADDQVFFGNTPFEIKDKPEIGLIHKEDKCGGIKWDGKLTDRGIRFLGYRLKREFFASETRSGTSVNLRDDIKALLSEEYISKIKTEDDIKKIFTEFQLNYDDDKYLEKIMKRNIFGFIFSCMSIGDGENSKGIEFSKKGLKNQLMKVNNKSGLGKAPDSTHSSMAMYYLNKAVRASIREKYHLPIM